MRPSSFIGFLCLLILPSVAGSQTASTERWRLIEELRIGAVDGPQAITRVGGIVVSPDRRHIFVSQPQETLVRMFDAESGRLVRTIGRSGGGPGEFGLLTGIGIMRDTLVVLDSRNSRYSLFSVDGEIVRDESVRSPPLVPIAIGADGTVIAETQASSIGARATGLVTSTRVVQMTRKGSIIRTLGGRDLNDTALHAEAGGRIFVGIQPLSENTFVRVAPDGSSLMFVDGRVSGSSAGRFYITRLGLRGDTIYRRAYRYQPRPVPQEIADSIYGRYSTVRMPELRDHIRLPAVLPPVSAVVLNADGSAWLRRGERNLETVDWLVLDPQGLIRASLTLPIGFRNPTVDGERVWGVVRDDLDISYVVRYRIRRPN